MRHRIVHAPSLADFTDRRLTGDFPDGQVFECRSNDVSDCRLVLFSEDVSEHHRFRALCRRDLGLLEQLPHDSLPRVLAWGDESGRMGYVTTRPEGTILRNFLSLRRLSWDEVADIGWQLASVVQHLHNSGLVHAGLSLDTICVTPGLRVTVVDSGHQRWVRAVREPTAEVSIISLLRGDLTALGCLLEHLAECTETDGAESEEAMAAWKQLIADLSNPQSLQFPETARDVQGRLGDILLLAAGEAMDVVTDRTGTGSSRSSIVDELLPDPETVLPRQPSDSVLTAGHVILALLAAAALIGSLWWIAAELVGKS